jgi:hypothetical protein
VSHRTVVEVEAGSWSDVRELSESLIVPHVFRGHEDATWGLSPTIERSAERGGVFPVDIRDREEWILREFARRSHQLGNAGSIESPVDVLALIQHHGGPTRLLDFTHSLYVAAFFALEFTTGPSVIWAVNLKTLEDAIADVLKLPREGGFFRLSHSKYDPIAHEIMTGKREARLVLPLEPFHMHERMSIQQALFLFPCDLSVSFEENLASSLGCEAEAFGHPQKVPVQDFIRAADADVPLLRIVLPRTLRNGVLEDLWQMNVNAATLFPGLDGFVRSLHYHMRAVSSIERWRTQEED